LYDLKNGFGIINNAVMEIKDIIVCVNALNSGMFADKRLEVTIIDIITVIIVNAV
jgi:hypothetical protein